MCPNRFACRNGKLYFGWTTKRTAKAGIDKCAIDGILAKTGGASKALPVCCIWKPQLYISSKSGGVVAFGYPLATYKNKIPTKSVT